MEVPAREGPRAGNHTLASDGAAQAGPSHMRRDTAAKPDTKERPNTKEGGCANAASLWESDA